MKIKIGKFHNFQIFFTLMNKINLMFSGEINVRKSALKKSIEANSIKFPNNIFFSFKISNRMKRVLSEEKEDYKKTKII